MMHKGNSEIDDKTLVRQSLAGDKTALENLIKKHQTWIYNVAVNLTGSSEDALDLMQETLIKVITNLSKFEHKSAFRTWVYRIVKNQFLNTRRQKAYQQTLSWEEFGSGLEAIPNEELSDTLLNKDLIVKEAKLSCMKGMLLCFTPEQRLVYVLGELFEVPDAIASKVMNITRANFRKRLSRARQQLYSFMNSKCGLINTQNPCRCARKTKGFIKKGYVDPENLQFQVKTIAKINQVIDGKLDTYENEGYKAYRQLFQEHNYQEPENKLDSLKKLLNSDLVKKIFEL
ncbi:RNA polymerase sigma factor [Fulvivirgaceae bacterium BMA12]|uniref:RNA polymerase sigma factor n=1 Tax=Agaribacillus aureus TaxID=3051825 RepID=A0ABT8LEZ9_9BACT|nr:RNA polymerase sigma factor [Fulvivirgaceae bacterium BMA12]